MPVLWKRERLYSTRLAAWHYWIATIGIVFYIISMWVAGIMQGLMWRAYDEFGFLQYSFAESGRAHASRSISSAAFGGVLFLPGALIMVYNLLAHRARRASARARSRCRGARALATAGRVRGRPMRFLSHEFIEKNAVLLLVLTLVTVAIGGIVEIVPLFTIETTIEHVKGVRPYSPLELAGRDIYVREGCYLCHSQLIRPFRDEVERYGHYSLAAESMYDHPFQWGSERIGPDLARVGGKYSNDWHVAHLNNPRDVVPESLMPPYAFLAEHPLDLDRLGDHLRTLRIVGVPYTDEMIADAKADAIAQADPRRTRRRCSSAIPARRPAASAAIPRASPSAMRSSPTCRCSARS